MRLRRIGGGKSPWLCAVSFIGCASFGGGLAVGRSFNTVTVTKEVIKEVLPPSVCVDTFKTRHQVLGEDPRCDHPAQIMSTVIKQYSDGRDIEITCKCPPLKTNHQYECK